MRDTIDSSAVCMLDSVLSIYIGCDSQIFNSGNELSLEIGVTEYAVG